PSPLPGQGAQSRPQFFFLLRALPLIPAARPRHAHEPTGSPFTQSMRLPNHAHHLAPVRGRQNFFATTVFKAWLSSVRSATTCFTRRFSSSSCRSRRASLISKPPYSPFHL